jgi:hypothetical protein
MVAVAANSAPGGLATIPNWPTTSTAPSPFHRNLAEGDLASVGAAETRHYPTSCCNAWNCQLNGRMVTVQQTHRAS